MCMEIFSFCPLALLLLHTTALPTSVFSLLFQFSVSVSLCTVSLSSFKLSCLILPVPSPDLSQMNSVSCSLSRDAPGAGWGIMCLHSSIPACRVPWRTLPPAFFLLLTCAFSFSFSITFFFSQHIVGLFILFFFFFFFFV